MDGDIEQAYAGFRADLAEGSEEEGDQAQLFFEIYERLAAENGDCIDLEYTPARSDGTGGYQIDGVAFDAERGALYLAICDYRPGAELETLNSAALDRLKQRLSRFVELAAGGINGDLSASGCAAATLISDQIDLVKRIRAVVFSNGRLSTRRPPEAAGEIAGIPVVYNVLDFARFHAIQQSRTGSEPITIELKALGAPPLVCLPASAGSGRYQSYLVAVPGETLATIYSLYGARLLEQNVRTFLQAKTKVNKGIIRTIRESPEMFFAYNNGLTATASGLTLAERRDGPPEITALDGLQIVNGGQTTASILYAKDKAKADLSEVFVQMKLTIVDPERIEEVVPRISRFANTQNRISEADFFSSHPFHVALEQISRRMTAPPKPGSVQGSKWFYERARGQYREAGASLTSAAKSRFDAEFPKLQMIDKLALAKHEMTFDCRPHTVSAGGQKCFLAFAEHIAKEWDASPLRFNDNWFRETVAKAILFRWTDDAINRAEWYRADRGFKAQTVTYTLAWLIQRARRQGKAGLNLGLVWSLQDVPEELQYAIMEAAPQVGAALRDAPQAVRNVGEYAKLQGCWASLSGREFEVEDLPDAILLDPEEARAAGRDAAQTRKVDLEVAFDTMAPRLGARADEIASLARAAKVLSPRSDAALRRLAKGDYLLPPADRTALRQMLDRLKQSGVELKLDQPSAQSDPAGEPRTLRLNTTEIRRVRL